MRVGKLSEKKGKQIVFQSLRDGKHEIYAMNADVTNQTMHWRKSRMRQSLLPIRRRAWPVSMRWSKSRKT
jgi:hypothetical protein